MSTVTQTKAQYKCNAALVTSSCALLSSLGLEINAPPHSNVFDAFFKPRSHRLVLDKALTSPYSFDRCLRMY